MANRHAHKKLRAEIRQRMAITGESYQAALQHLSARSATRAPSHALPALDTPLLGVPDLIATSYFGLSVTLAAYPVLSHVSLILVSGSRGLLGLPLGRPSPLSIHTFGVQ